MNPQLEFKNISMLRYFNLAIYLKFVTMTVRWSTKICCICVPMSQKSIGQPVAILVRFLQIMLHQLLKKNKKLIFVADILTLWERDVTWIFVNMVAIFIGLISFALSKIKKLIIFLLTWQIFFKFHNFKFQFLS